DPIPSARFGGEIFARPFMIEPRGTSYRVCTFVHGQRAGDPELRPAVVEARLRLARSLAAGPFDALQQHGWLRGERQRERKIPGGDVRGVDIAGKTQRPVVDAHVGRGFTRLRKAPACTR